MRVTLREGLGLWRSYGQSRWCRPRLGWLCWLLFCRQVESLADPVCEGSVDNAGPAPEWAPTVRVVRRLL